MNDRRRTQFSLWSIAAAMIVLSVAAWALKLRSDQAERRWAAVNALRNYDATMWNFRLIPTENGLRFEPPDAAYPDYSDRWQVDKFAQEVVRIDIPNGDLDLIRMSDSDIVALGEFPALEELRLVQMNISDDSLARLPPLPSLKELSLSGNPISCKSTAALRGLPALREISLSGTSVDDRIFEDLRTLEELREIWLMETSIDGKGLPLLSEMPELTHLWLDLTQVGDRELSTFEPPASLELIHVPLSNVTQSGAEEFMRRHPRVRVEFEY